MYPFIFSDPTFSDITELSFPKRFLDSASSHEILETLYCLLQYGNIKKDVIRAKKLIDTIIPVLVWIRENKKLPLHACYINQAMSLKWMDQIIHEAYAVFSQLSTNLDKMWIKNINLGKKNIDVSDMPEQFFINIATYLEELPNYNLSARLELQTSSNIFTVHNRATLFFIPIQKIKN